MTTAYYAEERSSWASFEGMIRAVSSITGQHWLYDWIDEYEILDVTSFRDRWRSLPARTRLIELIGQAERFSVSGVPESGVAVAGIGLDVGSRATCGMYKCRSAVLDTEFPQLLHYFDSVVMEGPSAMVFARAFLKIKNQADDDIFADAIENHVALLLHMRKIGLANYTIFKPNVECMCDEHLTEYARRLHVEHLVDGDGLLQFAKDLSKAGDVFVTQDSPREWFGSLTHPQFAGSTGFTISRKTKPKKYEFAVSILRRQLTEMIFDAATAEQLGVPLAALGEPDYFNAGPTTKLTVDDVALRVQIPVLQGLSTTEFIKLREAEYSHFERFQILLREAIEETIRMAETELPAVAAEIVWTKKIRPQLVDLSGRIASSNQALTRKIVSGVSVGAASVGIGSIAGALAGSVGSSLGTVIGAAAGTVAIAPTVLPFISKHLDERQEFERAGTYFLWKAGKATDHS